MSIDSLSTSGAASPSFSLAQLPPFCVIAMSEPSCMWGDKWKVYRLRAAGLFGL